MKIENKAVQFAGAVTGVENWNVQDLKEKGRVKKVVLVSSDLAKKTKVFRRLRKTKNAWALGKTSTEGSLKESRLHISDPTGRSVKVIVNNKGRVKLIVRDTVH